MHGIMPVQHPAMLNPVVTAFSTEEALCQVGFAHSTEIQPKVILLPQKLSLVARNGCLSWGCSRNSYSLPGMQHNMSLAPGLHPSRFSLRATELLDSDKVIALLPMQGVASRSVYITDRYCFCNHILTSAFSREGNLKKKKKIQQCSNGSVSQSGAHRETPNAIHVTAAKERNNGP